jgi:hypothetical protein
MWSSENLDAWSCGGWGVFIAPTTLVAVGEAAGDGRIGQSGAPPDRYCALSGVPLRDPTVRVYSEVDRWSFVLLRHRTVRCPLTSILWLLSRHCGHCSTLQSRLLALDSHCRPAGSPDSPVNYSGPRLRFPEGGWLTHVRPWCTGHCPVEHRTLRCAKPQHIKFFAPVQFSL